MEVVKVILQRRFIDLLRGCEGGKEADAKGNACRLIHDYDRKYSFSKRDNRME